MKKLIYVATKSTNKNEVVTVSTLDEANALRESGYTVSTSLIPYNDESKKVIEKREAYAKKNIENIGKRSPYKSFLEFCRAYKRKVSKA